MTDSVKEQDSSSIPSLTESDEEGEGVALYKYRDFSTVNIQELEAQARSSPESPTPHGANASDSSIRAQRFPVKLFKILAQKEFNEIITWMPHGRSWKVLKPNLFESMVMPLYFEYSNYHSFNRLVNAWSFRRIKSGPDRGSYYHELFLRGKADLYKYMRRLPKDQKKVPMKKQDDPDFSNLESVVPSPPPKDSSHMEQPKKEEHPTLNGGDISMGIGQAMGGLSAFQPRDPLLGAMNHQRFHGTQSLHGAGIGSHLMTGLQSMNAVNAVNGMQSLNGMGSWSGMGSLNGIGSLNVLGGMAGMAGIGGLSGFPTSPLSTWTGMNVIPATSRTAFDSPLDVSSAGLAELRRLRQVQQMQFLDRHMGSPSIVSTMASKSFVPVKLQLGSQ